MWKLELKKEVENEYLDKMLPGLVKRVQRWQFGSEGIRYESFRKRLLPDWEENDPQDTRTLKRLLTDNPKGAYTLNNQLMSEFINDYKESELAAKERPQKYKQKLNYLEKIFDYEGQLSKSKSKSYWLAELIGHNTCTYCNRQYTFTVSGKNDSERITRPAFDHWFPQSLFPLLSLNIYNLIPSCTVCNSGAKGDTILPLDKYVHPYLQVDDDPKFKFVPQVADKDDRSWSVLLKRNAREHPEVDNMIKEFALDRIYEMHGDLEVKELMDFAKAYNNTYLLHLFDQLKTDLGAINYSQEDVYRMLFGTEMEAANYLDRPLSKLKHDILEYLNIIK